MSYGVIKLPDNFRMESYVNFGYRKLSEMPINGGGTDEKI